MSFVEKVKQHQSTIIASVCGVAVGYILYRLVRGQPRQETYQQRRKRQIQLIRRQINTQNPSFQDMRKVMQYAIHEAKIKVTQFQDLFKQKRMRFTSQTRKQHFRQYLNLLYEGMQQMQSIAVNEQVTLFKQLGISEIYFRKYSKLLQKALDEIMHVQNKNIGNSKLMKLQEVKFAFRKQIQFVKQEGFHYAQLIINATKDWTRQQKATLPSLLSLIITDGAFEGFPQLNVNSVEYAERYYQKQLMGQLQQLQIQMAPMMIKLSTAIKQVSGFDLADFVHEAQKMDYQQIGKLRQFQRKRSQDYIFVNPYK